MKATHSLFMRRALVASLLVTSAARCGFSEVPATKPQPPPAEHKEPDVVTPSPQVDLVPPAPAVSPGVLSPATRVAFERLLERALPESARCELLALLEHVDEDERAALLGLAEVVLTSRAYAPVADSVRLASVGALAVVATPERDRLAKAMLEHVPLQPVDAQEDLIAAATSAPTARVTQYLERVADLMAVLHTDEQRVALARTLARVPGPADAQFKVACRLLWAFDECPPARQANFTTAVAYLVAGAARDQDLLRYLDALLSVAAVDRPTTAAGLAAFVSSRREGSTPAQARIDFLLERPENELVAMTTAIAHFFVTPHQPDVLDDVLRLKDDLWTGLLVTLAKRGGDAKALHVLAGAMPEDQALVLQEALRLLQGPNDQLTDAVMAQATARRQSL